MKRDTTLMVMAASGKDMNKFLQLAQDYEDCLQFDIIDTKTIDKNSKRDIRKIKKLIKKLRKLGKRYNTILK